MSTGARVSTNDPESRVGSTVGEWKLGECLGSGAVGTVYRAKDSSGRVAAVKVLHPELVERQDVRERFLREVAALRAVKHSGAVQVLESGRLDDGLTFLVMELCEGEPLSTRVKRLGKLPVADLLSYLDQVLDVLAVAHESGIVHRDLKPQNLMVGPTGQVKVLDFGLARRLEDTPGDFKTRPGLALGTLPYMAPEQALGRRGEVDGRVDLFALGATAFRILAGRKVHEADSPGEMLMKMASTPAPPLRDYAPQLSRDLCDVVDVSLAFSKDARYPDARTMQADVRCLLAGQPPTFARDRRAGDRQHTEMRSARQATEPMPASVRPGSRVAVTEPMPASSRRVPPTVLLRAVDAKRSGVTRSSHRLLRVAVGMLLLGILGGGLFASSIGSQALNELRDWIESR